MNQKKRTLELIGSILAIIFGAIYLLSTLIILSSIDELIKDMIIQAGGNPTANAIASARPAVIFGAMIDLVLAGLVLAFGIVLCIAPKCVNGIIKERKGFSITLVVILGLNLFNQLTGGFSIFTILVAASFILLLISVCMRHDYVFSGNSYNPYQGYQYNPSNNQFTNPLFNNQQGTTENNEKKE